MTYFWYFIGVLLSAWVAWDLYHGYTLIWSDFVYRDQTPSAYWTGIVVWAALAISCFIPWGGNKE